MRVQIEVEGRIESVKVFNASADYIIVARNGKIIREYNPALAKAYRKKTRKDNKGRFRSPQSLPDGIHATKLNVRKYEVSRGDVSQTKLPEFCQGCTCRNCILQVAQECVGAMTICEAYRPSPRDVTYYH